MDSRTNAVHAIREQLSAMLVGQRLRVSRLLLYECVAYSPAAFDIGRFLGKTFDPVDEIMEGLVGSAYSFLPMEDPMTGDITFDRVARGEVRSADTQRRWDSGQKTWVYPDRRHLYRKRFDGWWELVRE